MKTLDEIMLGVGSDKSSINHDYCPHYETWFAPLRNEPLTILELGIGGDDTQTGGNSLKGWLAYFPNAIVGGVDLYDKSFINNYDERLTIYKGSQDDPVFLNEVIKDLGTPDVIVDDASHLSKLTIDSFEILFPVLKSGGLYCIEDLSCSFRWDFGGSKNLDSISEPTTLNYFFKVLQDMCNPQYGVPYTKVEKWKDIESICFTPELLIIKKK